MSATCSMITIFATASIALSKIRVINQSINQSFICS